MEEKEVILFCDGVPFTNLQVDVSEDFGRCAHANDANIERKWQAKLAANPKMFNGAKFRYSSVSTLGGGHVKLNLGLTDYRSFMGTNMSSEWKSLLDESKRHANAGKGDGACFLANPLGNGAIVETSDGMVVLLCRSQAVGECPGMIVFPGGHPEPIEIEKRGGSSKQLSSKQVVYELADSLKREIVEETGIGPTFLSAPLLIGFCRRTQNHRPDYFGLVHCSLSWAQVKHQYETGAVEDKFESTKLLAFPADQLEQMVDGCGMGMPGCHRGGMELYRMYREARKVEQRRKRLDLFKRGAFALVLALVLVRDNR